MGIGSSKGAFYEDEFGQSIGKNLNSSDNNEWSPNEIMPHTPEPVDPSHYETALTDEQEGKFQDWKSKMAPNDSGHDYDLRGAFLNNVTPDSKTGHWPDTFKKPNHPTFSDQSMYAGERPDLAGRWQGDIYIPPLPISPISFTEKGGLLTPMERINQYPEMFEAGKKAVEIEQQTGKMPPINQKGLRGGNFFKDDLAFNVTTSTGVTITDEDIDKAMNLGMSFSGGGLTTSKVVPMRKAANDNKPVYNPREPNMIGKEEVDKEILRTWEEQVAKHQRGNEIFTEQDKLMEILNTRKWSDLEQHKWNKLDKEHQQLFPPGNYPD